MRFLVTRTGTPDEVQPCYSAEPFLYRVLQRYDEHPFATTEALENFWAFFQQEGMNHRRENGVMTREMTKQGWAIEIGNLDDLLRFQDTHGDLVITKSDALEGLREIEIYDGYRE